MHLRKITAFYLVSYLSEKNIETIYTYLKLVSVSK